MRQCKYNFFFFFFGLEIPFLSDCIHKLSIQTASISNVVDLVGPEMTFGPNVEKRTPKIRKFFPETWIWDLIPVGYVSCITVCVTVLINCAEKNYFLINAAFFFPLTRISGSVDIAKTVPDTITKWAAGAFCTSRILTFNV